MKTKIIALVCTLAGSGSVLADIAQPDGIVYGTLSVDGAPVGDRELLILARVRGFDEPVAAYRMGDLPAAGDRFVLHVRHALQNDGKTRSADTAQTGDAARVFVKGPDGPEVFVGEVPVPGSGRVVELNIELFGQELETGRLLGVQSSPSCGGSAGMCGAMSMISLSLMCCALAGMKHRHYRARKK